MAKFLQLTLKSGSVENLQAVADQPVFRLRLSDSLAAEFEKAIKEGDKIDADAGQVDGDLDIHVAIRQKLPRKLAFFQLLTGATLDLDLDFELDIVDA